VSDANPGAIMTAAAITSDTSADATGTAGHFRILTQSGGTAIAEGSCGTSGADMNFNTVSISSGSTVAISSFTITQPES
jgi:formylmethanofuran dehydrogenase subunit C